MLIGGRAQAGACIHRPGPGGIWGNAPAGMKLRASAPDNFEIFMWLKISSETAIH